MKKRTIPSILIKGGTNIYLSQKFSPWRSVGALVQNLRLHVGREADELLIINPFKNNKDSVKNNKRLFELVRKEVNIPISYIGGIRTVEDASFCINSGFDKIFLTEVFLENIVEFKKIINLIGSQSVGVCLPYKRDNRNDIAFIFDYKNKTLTSKKLLNCVQEAILNGAGEIILFNVDKDGSLEGLDYKIIDEIKTLDCFVPILLSGGMSTEEDVYKALSNDIIQGIVGSSIFSLTKATPSTIRNYCISKSLDMRRT